MWVLIFSTIFVKIISRSKNNWMRYDHKCTTVFIKSTRCSYQILMKLEFCRKIFEKFSNVKFHENPSSVSRVVPCGRTDIERWTDRRTGMTKPVVVFHSFAKQPKNSKFCPHCIYFRMKSDFFPLYNTHCLVFTREAESVYWSVRTGSLKEFTLRV